MSLNMSTPAPVKLLLVDDHPLVRDGVRVRLEAVPHFEVVGEAGDLSLIHITEPTRQRCVSRMPSSA